RGMVADQRSPRTRPAAGSYVGGSLDGLSAVVSIGAISDDSVLNLLDKRLDLLCHRVNGASQVGGQLQLSLGLMEVVVGLRLLQRALAVLPDQDERRKEDRFQRNDQRQELKREGVDAEETRRDPEREDRHVYPHEGHRARKRRDLIGEVQLPV